MTQANQATSSSGDHSKGQATQANQATSSSGDHSKSQAKQASQAKEKVPAIDGWFDVEADAPALLGRRCSACGTYTFGQQLLRCPNPACDGSAFETVHLSRRGRIWSYTDARYQPPPPYVAADPFVPFALAAVELADEKMVVMGQMVPGVSVDDLSVGQEVELVIDTLYEDDEREYLIWKWQPVTGEVSDA